MLIILIQLTIIVDHTLLSLFLESGTSKRNSFVKLGLESASNAQHIDEV